MVKHQIKDDIKPILEEMHDNEESVTENVVIDDRRYIFLMLMRKRKLKNLNPDF